MTTRRAFLYVGNCHATRVPPGEYGTDTVPSIRVVSTVDDEDHAFPHFIVEYSNAEPQDDDVYDNFRIMPLGVELGASRNMIVAAYEWRAPTFRPPPGCVRAHLYRNNLAVEDLPLKEYATVGGGRVRVARVVHDTKYSADPYFFVEILQEGSPIPGAIPVPNNDSMIRFRFDIESDSMNQRVPM